MAKFLVIVIFGVLAVAQAQRGGARVSGDERRVTTTPVPILRQINKVNEDGSYTYGYESGDGSYKIETKAVNGEVQGKYGYYDDTGALREIEYGASRQGFNPQGTDVKLPQSARAMAHHEFDDTGAYDSERYDRPFAYDPSAYQQPQQQQQISRPAAAGRRPGSRRPKQQQQFNTEFSSFPQSAPRQNYQQPQQFPAPQAYQQPQQQAYQQPAPQQAPQQQQPYQPPQQHHVVNHQAHQYQAPAPTQAPFNPSQLFEGHPARNIDINTGSYSVQYHG